MTSFVLYIYTEWEKKRPNFKDNVCPTNLVLHLNWIDISNKFQCVCVNWIINKIEKWEKEFQLFELVEKKEQKKKKIISTEPNDNRIYSVVVVGVIVGISNDNILIFLFFWIKFWKSNKKKRKTNDDDVRFRFKLQKISFSFSR